MILGHGGVLPNFCCGSTSDSRDLPLPRLLLGVKRTQSARKRTSASRALFDCLTLDSTERTLPDIERAERVFAHPPGPDHHQPYGGPIVATNPNTTSDLDSQAGIAWE